MVRHDEPRPVRRFRVPAGAVAGILAIAAAMLPGTCAPSPYAGEEGTAGTTRATGGAARRPYHGRISVQVTTRDGRPVARAEVRARIEDPDGIVLTAVERTRADGRVTLRGLPDGEARVRAEAAGYARAYVTSRVADGAGGATLVLDPGARLAGQVVDEGGRPIANASVEARPDTGDEDVEPWVAMGDEEGRFSFDTLLAGWQRLDASATGYEPTSRLALAALEGAQEVRIVLRRTGIIAGRVLGSDGEPAGGADVILAGSGVWPPRQIAVGEDGRFAFRGVPGGVYEVGARRGNEVAPPREGLVLVAGGTADLTLRLGVGASLSGIVVDAENDEPIAGAEVVVSEEGLAFVPHAVRTGANGHFRVSGLRPREHQILVRAADYVTAPSVAAQPGGEPVRVALRRAATLVGVVVDARGAPVAGAQLEILGTTDAGESVAATAGELEFRTAVFEAHRVGPTPLEPTGELGVTLGEVPPIPLGGSSGAEETPADPRLAQQYAEAAAAVSAIRAGAGPGPVTDQEGRFRLTGVPPGRIQLVARHRSHAPAATRPFLVTAGALVEDLEIVLPEGGVIDGRVVDQRRFPVGFVAVEMRAEGEPFPRMAFAGEDGTFRFEGALGRVTLTALPGGTPAARIRVDVASGQQLEVELPVEEHLVTLSGRTVDDRGWPVAAVAITVRSLRAGSPVERMAVSAEDGTFEIGALPPPPYRVDADHAEMAPARLERVSSAEGELRITMRPGASVRGQVLDDWESTPLEGAAVELRRGRSTAARAVTDAEGRFELWRVGAGDYTIVATHPGFMAGEAPARMRATRWGLEDLELDPIRIAPGGGVEGEVVDALGYGVSGAEVTAGEPADWSKAVRTDPQGRFTLSGLAAGSVVLTARHPAAGEASPPGAVRIRAGDVAPGVRIRLPERFDAARAELGEGRQNGVAVTVRDAGGAVRIATVVAASEAFRAGVRAGDVLVAVDEEPVTSAEQARELLRGAVGVDAVLDLRRGEAERRLLVARESWELPRANQ